MSSTATPERIRVEVAYALPERQHLVSLALPQGATVRDAIEASGLRERVDGLTVDEDRLGVFGRKRPPDHVLEEGDRVEIYRPLIADPKEVRRERARRDRDSGS